MEDLTGKQFGAYRIIAPLGEGGMASVFKAYQASMDRYVALKVLPRHFANDPDFIHRFEREARIIAKLEHPNILPVHDFGEAEGYYYLVMRFVKGGDLASAMAAHPLSPAQIMKVISELASALEYAHDHGVIHRDLKPQNVLMDEQGNCLLSDFGLAKMMTASSLLTLSGVFIGTPTYASPEQCLGVELDARSDIYSLGIILYEMYTGRPPFRADTPMGVVLKHINDPLPLPRSLNPAIPEAVERVILRALSKQPADRFSTVSELASALLAAQQSPAEAEEPAKLPPAAKIPLPLEDAAFVDAQTQPPGMRMPAPASQTPPPALPVSKPKWILWLPVAGVATLLAILAVVLVPRMLPGSAPTPTTASTKVLAAEFKTTVPAAATSTSAPTATPPPHPTVTTAPSTTPTPSPTATTAPSATPPPPTATTAPPTVTPTLAPTPLGGGTGKILFTSARDGHIDIYLMNADGSGSICLTSSSYGTSYNPAWSPDGNKIVFNSTRDSIYGIYVLDLRTSKVTRLSGKTTGDFMPAWSPDGKKIAFNSTIDGNNEIYVMDADGSNRTRLTVNPQDDSAPAWSPDGKKIAFASYRDGNYEIYVMNADGSDLARLTTNSKSDYRPVWSPDGKKIAFYSDRDSNYEIYVMDADGSHQTRLTHTIETNASPAWSPDGKMIVFSSNRDGNTEVYVMNADGSQQTRLTNNPSDDYYPSWQPANPLN